MTIPVLTTALGLGVLLAGVFLLSVPAGLVVAGVLLTVAGLLWPEKGKS